MVQPPIYIFMGPPGAGKGTLAARCVESLGWKQLSTGALLREYSALQTEMGKQIDFILKSGTLVSDDLIIEMVEHWLTKHKQEKAIILDGFPRTIAQARALVQMLKKVSGDCIKLFVVRLNLNDEALVRRLSSRAMCSNVTCQEVYTIGAGQKLESMQCTKCSSSLIRRPDDVEETIRKRLTIYHAHENDLLRYFEHSGQKVIDIPADSSMPEVFDCFKQKIEIPSRVNAL